MQRHVCTYLDLRSVKIWETTSFIPPKVDQRQSKARACANFYLDVKWANLEFRFQLKRALYESVCKVAEYEIAIHG